MKCKLIISFSFIIFLFVSGTAFSEELFEKNSIDFNLNIEKSPKELFIPIGFDTDKKFSYLYKKVPENVGCDFWSFNIMDLSNDKVLENVDTPFYDCESSRKNPALGSFELEINNSLESYAIKKGNLAIKTFPLISSDKTISVCIGDRSPTVMKEAVTKHARKIIIFDSINKEAKVIATFNEIEFGGALQKYAPKIEGYFQNPTTGRLAVVVSYIQRGHGGEDNIRRVNIYGSSLNMKKNSDLLSLCENRSIAELDKKRHALNSLPAEKTIVSTDDFSSLQNPITSQLEQKNSSGGSIPIYLIASLLGILAIRSS